MKFLDTRRSLNHPKDIRKTLKRVNEYSISVHIRDIHNFPYILLTPLALVPVQQGTPNKQADKQQQQQQQQQHAHDRAVKERTRNTYENRG